MKKTLLILTLTIVSFSSYSADYYDTTLIVTEFKLSTGWFYAPYRIYDWRDEKHIVRLRSNVPHNDMHNFYNTILSFNSSTDNATKKLISLFNTMDKKCFNNVINSMSGLSDSEFNTLYGSNFLDYNHNFIPDIYETDMILSNDIIFYLKNIIMFICFGIGFFIGALFLKGLL